MKKKEETEEENLQVGQKARKDQDLLVADLHSIKKEIKEVYLKANEDLNFILSNNYRMY